MAEPSYDFLQQMNTAFGPAPKPYAAAPAPPTQFDEQLATALGRNTAAQAPPIDNSAALSGGFTVTPPAAPAPAAPPAPAAAPAAPATPVSAPAGQPAEATEPPTVQFRAVGGGATPAREQYMRGPKQEAHLQAAFDAAGKPIEGIDLRNQLAAQHEADVYEIEAEKALRRQEAMTAASAKREQQLDNAFVDYQQSVQHLSQMQPLDQNRWWANKSTGDKIGTIFLSFLGGLGAQGNGGQNYVMDRINKEIDGDVAAQKFDYEMGLNQAKAKQTAYGMLMDKYQSEDAAEAAARAAALDYAQMKLGQVSAHWKGTESANQADELRAQIAAQREKTIENGFKFIPAVTAAPKYKMVINGQEVPGLVSEGKAQEYAIEHGVKPGEEIDKELVKGGVQTALKDQELAAKQKEKTDESAKFISRAEQEAKIPEREAVLKDARTRHVTTPLTGKERAASWFLGLNFQSSPSLYKYVFGKNAAEREQAWAGVIAEKRHELAGANVTPEEAKPIMASLEGARDNDSRLAAITRADKAIKAQKTNIRAGTPDSGESYDQNKGNVKTGGEWKSSAQRYGGKK